MTESALAASEIARRETQLRGAEAALADALRLAADASRERDALRCELEAVPSFSSSRVLALFFFLLQRQHVYRERERERESFCLFHKETKNPRQAAERERARRARASQEKRESLSLSSVFDKSRGSRARLSFRPSGGGCASLRRAVRRPRAHSTHRSSSAWRARPRRRVALKIHGGVLRARTSSLVEKASPSRVRWKDRS